MKHYFKSGQNMRILNPGDFFISKDGQNYTYDGVIPMSNADRERIGVYELESDDEVINGSHGYNTEMLLGRINEIKSMKILETFRFQGERYNCTSKDLATISVILALAQDIPDSDANLNNLHWFNSQIPFFWCTSDGDIRNMDLATFKDFAKKMTLHVLANNMAALTLNNKAITGVDVDIQDDSNWPDTYTMSAKYLYEEFSRQYIEAKFGNSEGITVDQNQPADLRFGGVFASEPNMTFDEIESVLNDLSTNGS